MALGSAGVVLRQSSTPKVVPGAALPWLQLGRVGGYNAFEGIRHTPISIDVSFVGL